MVVALVTRIKALARKTDRADSTISAAVLNSGAALASLESGDSTITFAKYERAMAKLDELEAVANEAKAA
jgi:hypothetical protein